MGRTRSRKQHRRGSQRVGEPVELVVDREALLREALVGAVAMAPHGQTCGGCKEFFEGGEEGRGECLHPGSGVLLPWPDTAACHFYAARRR